MKERILAFLSDVWLIALFFFAGGAIREILISHNFWIQILIPIWFDSNYAVSIIIATVFFFFVWKYDRVNGIAWFLFYDATFELTNAGSIKIDPTTFIFLLVSVLLFCLKPIKFDILLLVVVWSILALLDAFLGSNFAFQVIWVFSVLYTMRKSNGIRNN